MRGNYLAIAGVKGAAPGSAAQVIDANDAFLRVSLNRDRRPLAAAVDWVRWGSENETIGELKAARQSSYGR